MNRSENLTDAITSDACRRHLHYDVIRETLIIYTSPVLLVCGLVGNFLILAVLRRRELGHMPPGPYLAALAIVDIIVLGSGLVELWLDYGFNISFRKTDIGFKLILYVIYASIHSSAWLIVTVTIERLISICCPFRALKIRRNHRISVSVTIIILCLCLNVHFLIYINTKSIEVDYLKFLIQIWSIIDFLLASVIPFIVIVACNIGIVVASGRSRRLRGEQGKENDARLTRLLITLNIFFIITTCPVTVLIIYNGYSPATSDKVELARRKLIMAFLSVLMYLNNTMNFVLYCVTGKRFRVALLALLRCKSALREMSQSGVSDKTAVAS